MQYFQGRVLNQGFDQAFDVRCGNDQGPRSTQEVSLTYEFFVILAVGATQGQKTARKYEKS